MLGVVESWFVSVGQFSTVKKMYFILVEIWTKCQTLQREREQTRVAWFQLLRFFFYLDQSNPDLCITSIAIQEQVNHLTFVPVFQSNSALEHLDPDTYFQDYQIRISSAPNWTSLHNVAYWLGMGVRNRLLEYYSLQMNSVGGQANSSLHIHTQTKFSEANVSIFCRRH